MLKRRIICAAAICALLLSGCGSFYDAVNDRTDGILPETYGGDYGIKADSPAVTQDATTTAPAVTQGSTTTNAAATQGATTTAPAVTQGSTTTNAAATQGSTTANIAVNDPSIAATAGINVFDNSYNNNVQGQPIENEEVEAEQELPQAGLLTAGCWSDNENWGFFSNLIKSDRLSFPLFDLDPTKRIAVTLKTADGKPAQNQEAELVNDKDEVIWKGVSDYQGRVYLMNKTDDENVYVKAASGEKSDKVEISKADGSQQGTAAYSADVELVVGSGKHTDNADVMFIIDTTGSMYDEMTFLQSEFTEITNRIGDKNTRYSVNFYRDEGDEYLTKCNPFSSDVAKVQKTISDEEAAGGKGQIAAVAQALEQTMNAADWSEDSVKIAFLIFDAPPYKEAAESLAKSVETAAARGIRLIPVVGSGSDSDVEHFGRAIAIETGGKYIFITDDSGIGESHEEPIIGEYEVRPLVDIMTDVINEYRAK